MLEVSPLVVAILGVIAAAQGGTFLVLLNLGQRVARIEGRLSPRKDDEQ